MKVPDNVFAEAVKHFWTVRDRQQARQLERGQTDQGARSAVTGGKQMDGFLDSLSKLLKSVGVPEGAIHTRTTQLPGFFRPTKEWDLIVVVDRHLLAAIEVKSHIGPSFGNNFNNRTEEALGSSLDIWRAYREGAFKNSPQPWLGYLLLLEDCPRSRAPVKVSEPHYPVFKEFNDASYAKRYELFCQKLVRERLYTAACLLMASSEDRDKLPNYTEPSEEISASRFVKQLLAHVKGNL